jgi:hypothetical protein
VRQRFDARHAPVIAIEIPTESLGQLESETLRLSRYHAMHQPLGEFRGETFEQRHEGIGTEVAAAAGLSRKAYHAKWTEYRLRMNESGCAEL